MKKGFTLIEIIVATAIFAIVMTISSGALLSIVNANRKSQALKSVMNNLNFALEDMSREIRAGANYSCGGSGCSEGGSDSFSFYSSSYLEGEKTIYSFDREKKTITKQAGSDSPVPITANEVQIDSLKFYVTGIVPGDEIQPRVLILLKGTADSGEKTASSFDIQTTVSQRRLDE